MGRQPNGHSTIRLGADGRFHSWVTLGVRADGKLERKHVSRETATAVADEITELRSRRAVTGVVAKKGETAGDWFTFYLENVVRPNRAYKTYAGYASIFNQHVIPHLGGYRLVGMRNLMEPDHLESFYAHLRTKRGGKLAPSYVLQIHHVISRAVKVAMRRGRASRNPCDLMDPPEGGTAHIESLSLSVAQAVIVAAVHDEMAARWVLGLVLGYRQGEALGVRWSYLDLEEATIRPARQLQRQTWRHGCDEPQACAQAHCAKKAARPCPPSGCAKHKRACPPPCPPNCTDHARSCPEKWGGGLVEVDTKSQTGKGKAMPMPPLLVELLRVHRERQIRQCAEWDIPWDPKGLVFTGKLGKPIDPRRDHAAWEDLLRRAGVDDARLHAARHTAGTLMVAGGTDISVVQELLRHASITTTREYVDIAADLKREAVEKIALTLFDGDLQQLMKALAVPKQRSSDVDA